MYRKRMKMNSHGFTLVEVIASIAILGLVVISLLPFFPQVLTWSKATDDQLVTDHLLGQVAYDLKEDLIDKENRTLKNLAPGNLSLTNKFDYNINNITYTPIVNLTQTREEKRLNLYRAQIEISGKVTYVFLKEPKKPGEN